MEIINGVETINGSKIVNPDIDGGTIDSTIIGGTTPAAGTFTALKGNFDEIIEAATRTIVAAEMKGQIINNYGQTGDTVLTLDAAFEGAYFTVILGTTVAKYFRLDPNDSDGIILDGAAIDTDGHYVGIASAAKGAAIQFMAIQTGASTYDWFATTISGAWVSE